MTFSIVGNVISVLREHPLPEDTVQLAKYYISRKDASS